MGDKNPKDYKGKSVIVHEDEPDVINQEPIQHPPRIQHPNLPPGFKLQPSDDELVSYYIKNKIRDPTRFRPSFIPDTNIYDYLPRELLGTYTCMPLVDSFRLSTELYAVAICSWLNFLDHVKLLFLIFFS